MKKKQSVTPDEETREKIILRWRKSKLNSIPDIDKEFGLSQFKVHAIINKYLSSKV